MVGVDVLDSRCIEDLFQQPPNLYIKQLEPNYWVCFNPDAYGGAIVVSDEVKSVILKENFGDDFSRVKEIINSLVKVGILYSREKTVYENRHRSKKQAVDWLHLTNQCNLRCKYCYVDKNSGKLDFDKISLLITKIIEDCKERGFSIVNFKFAGGEPLLAFPLIQKIVKFLKNIRHLDDIAVKLGLLTNGTLITPSIAKFLKNEEVYVSVSLDGLQTENDRTRFFPDGSGSYEKITRGISILRDNDINPLILTVVSPDNARGLDVFMDWLVENDLSSRFSLSRDTFSVDFQNLEKLNRDLIENLFRAYDVLLNRLPKRRIGAFHSLGNLSFDKPIIRNCGAGSNGFAVTHKGHFASCQQTLTKYAEFDGKGNHLDFLRSQFDFNGNVNDFETCGGCQWKGVCGGDCVELKKQLWNRRDCPSPYCQTFKEIIPKLIDLRGWQLIKIEKEVLKNGKR